MSLRPVPARWFEALVPRMHAARATGTLARTGAVELEAVEATGITERIADLEPGLERYHHLLDRYRRYLARGQLTHSSRAVPPGRTLHLAQERLERRKRAADTLIDRLQALEEELVRLRLWEQILGCGEEHDLDLDLLADCGPVLEVVIAVLPSQSLVEHQDPMLLLVIPLALEQCVLGVGPPTVMAAFAQQVRLLNGRALARPSWLRGTATQAVEPLHARHAEYEQLVAGLYAGLDALHTAHGLPEALGDLACLEWFARHVGSLPASRYFVWITGWTDEVDAQPLAAALKREGSGGLIHFPPPPAGVPPPQLLHNPWWVRPFEIFSRALGMLGGDEVDPSPWLAAVVPLLFGYMFGDVGQGLMLVAFGWWLRRRWPLARLLIAGGLSATAFGLLFGSVFGREDILPALWLHPMREPLLVLGVPLAFAVALLSLGQILNALEARWRGEARHWWRVDGGMLVLYVGAAGSFVYGPLQMLALAGAAWYILGRFWGRPVLAGLLGGVGGLLEHGVRLSVNTVSFARVGAFALAHAGLSSAMVSLAEAAGSAAGALLVMVVGNAVIILLEGLVVSIQTTRLVLFEFFTRFVRGRGRSFRPLPPPPTVLRGESYDVAS